MTRLLVVNADDLGLSEAVNAGILLAHEHGIVTSASLMVRGEAAAGAARLAAKQPLLGLGLHVDLAEWVCEDGEWRATYAVVDTDDPEAVAAELERQLTAFRALTGREPTHLDSHQHIHRSEPVRSIMGVRARELGLPLRHHGYVRYRGDFYGQGSAGAPHPEAITAAALARIVGSLPEGATELCCHPATSGDGLAYGVERVRELEALCDPAVRAAIERAGVELCTFQTTVRSRPVRLAV
jgi:chitin disaccharide deacetylase